MFIDQWNGIGLFLSPLWETSDALSLFTDASGSLGYGGIFQKRWFQGKWLPCQQLGQRGVSIVWQELYAINVDAICGGPIGHPSASTFIVTIRVYWRSSIPVDPKSPG